MSIRNVKLRLNMEREEDRRALEFLESQEESFTKTVVSVICEYLVRSHEEAGTDAYWEKFTSVIREELANHNPLAALLNLLQTTSTQSISVLPADAEENTPETEEALFGFLDSF